MYLNYEHAATTFVENVSKPLKKKKSAKSFCPFVFVPSPQTFYKLQTSTAVETYCAMLRFNEFFILLEN